MCKMFGLFKLLRHSDGVVVSRSDVHSKDEAVIM